MTFDLTRLIYKPDNTEPQLQNATIGVKFCQDTFLMRSFLDQHKIPYKEEELEDGPLGKGIRLKKEKNVPTKPEEPHAVD